MSVVIVIEKKFTSINLSETIKKFWEVSLNESEVTFDLKQVEWISLEEITFLFGWIRHVKHNSRNLKKFHINLPLLGPTEDEILSNENVTEETIRRRKTRLISLWDKWKIFEKCQFQKGEYDVSKEINKYINNDELTDNNWHSIVPFFAIPLNNYQNVYDLRETIKADVEKKFKLQEHVLSILTDNTANSAFENKSLSNIITAELYLNVIHHSFNPDIKDIKECYFAIALRNKIDIENYIRQKKKGGQEITKEAANKNIQFIVEQNAFNERPEDEREFFKVGLNDRKFRNESFIEFTFTDFGLGIASTLKDKYLEEIQDPTKIEFLKAQLSALHFNELGDKTKVNLDSLILEYAFLLHSTRHPFETQLEINSYIPRGLYFLLDIVKAYQGMVVARSNKGKVVYDFANKKEIKDAVTVQSTDDGSFYPGTLISIYLPAERQRGQVKLGPVQRVLHYKKNQRDNPIHYINVSDLQQEAINIFKFENDFLEPPLTKAYNLVFKALNEKLDEFNKNECVLYIDFAGLDASVIDHKIYYYLTNTPKINENTSVVILNGTDKNILKTVQESIINSKDFICRPIPCIFSNDEVVWIGIKNINDEKTLNELWKYVESNVSMYADKFSDSNSLTGNVIKVDWVNHKNNEGNVSLNMLSSDEIANYQFKIPQPSKKYLYEIIPAVFIKSVLSKEEKHKVLLKKENEIYWTSGGYYQKEFIRFIEKLYEVNLNPDNVTKYENDLEFGRKVSAYLIRKYEYILDTQLEFDCIVSVTLSSQLLASAVRDVYCEIKNITNEKNKPTLIRLANYYEFTNEKAFKKIKPNQKVLIVNDVISTGRLNEEIFESLTGKEKAAEVVGIFSIVDSRQEEKLSDGVIIKPEVTHYSNADLNKKTIWLLKNPIEKYNTNPKPGAEIISIDPVINTPNTMRYERSDVTRLIYSDGPNTTLNNSEFLKKINDPKMLLVGHLHHNVAHHSYFFKLHEWFLSNGGQELINFLVRTIRQSYSGTKDEEMNLEKKKTIVDFIENELLLNESFFKDSDAEIFKQYNKTLEELAKLKVDSKMVDLPVHKYKSDLVFYPMFSGAEVLDKADYKRVFEMASHTDFILFPLGRVVTPRGWRFTFPPKVLNEITQQYKNVFILDDGTCTGDTLMQIIDSVAFLNVERIIVLSVVGRLEDFQREFFTRLQSIKVIYEKLDKKIKNRIVPLNIFFGAHFHIHVYPAFSSSCPFCEEIQILESEKVMYPPEPVMRFIDRRMEELTLYETDGFKYEQYSNLDNSSFQEGLISYLPKDIDRVELFLYRDKIGKLSSYRTFREYLNGFSETNLETWVAILLHEPKLLKTIEQLLPTLKTELVQFIKKVFTPKEKDRIPALLFSWKQSQLIRFLNLIDNAYLSESQNLKNLINFLYISKKPANLIADLPDSLDLILYHLWKQIIAKESIRTSLSSSKKYVQVIDEVWISLDKKRTELENVNRRNLILGFDKLINWIRLNQSLLSYPHDIFMKLKKFYQIKSTEFPNHNVYLQPFDLLIGQLRRILNFYQSGKVEFVTEMEIQKTKDYSVDAFSKLNESPLRAIGSSKFQKIFQKTSIYEDYANEKNFETLSFEIQRLISDLSIGDDAKIKIIEIKAITEQLMEIYLSGRHKFADFFKEHESNFGKIFLSIHDDFEAKLIDYNIQFSVSEIKKMNDAIINMHPDLLRQIIQQLYNNSIKHTKYFRDKYPENTTAVQVNNSLQIDKDKLLFHHTQEIPNENGSGKGYDDIEAVVDFFGGKVIKHTETDIFSVTIEFLLSNFKLNIKNGN